MEMLEAALALLCALGVGSLLWLLFGAAYLYFFGVPKWVSLILLTLACVKLLLDWMFTVWYRRQY